VFTAFFLHVHRADHHVIAELHSINVEDQEIQVIESLAQQYPSEQPRLVSGGDPARRGEVSQIRHVAPGHAGQYGL